ncbi:MAG: cell division protein SepF [Clostridiales bacterium]|nr:cell division protein SepF [Clostridiales bacterium]
MGLWQRIKVRLGLEDDWDEEYDDENDDYDGETDEPRRSDASYGRDGYSSPYATPASTSVKRLSREPDIGRARDATPLRSVPAGGEVSAMRPQLKMAIVEPKSFTEAQAIADKFKSGTPVIMNMSATKPDLAKRVLDFASGLTYGLDGGLQKVSDKVFMLTPANVDVSAEDRRRLRDTGLFTME